MAKYIDAEQLKNTLQANTASHSALRENPEHQVTRAYLLAIKHAMEDIDVFSTHFGLAVVRCKDCEYWENGKNRTPYCCNIDGLNEPDANDFCSFGERKEQ